MNGFLIEPQLIKAMYYQDKIIKVFFVFIYLIVSSCTLNEEQKNIDFSKKMVSKNEQILVYNQAVDSINLWKNNSLKNYIQTKYDNWKLDTILCFNQNGDKFISSILLQSSFFKSAVQDDIWYFYGVKIKQKWYFFQGPSIVLPREIYQENTNTPLSFEKLHEIAMKQIYRGYLKPKGFLGLGGYEINDGFFQDLTSVAWYPGSAPKNQAEWDAIYLKIVQENWSKRDTTVYKPDQ